MRNSKSNLAAFLRGFFKADDGLVTVEWVALAGALVIGAITVGWIVMNGLSTPATAIDTSIVACSNAAATSGGTPGACQ